jgi:hypothetical protein
MQIGLCLVCGVVCKNYDHEEDFTQNRKEMEDHRSKSHPIRSRLCDLCVKNPVTRDDPRRETRGNEMTTGSKSDPIQIPSLRPLRSLCENSGHEGRSTQGNARERNGQGPKGHLQIDFLILFAIFCVSLLHQGRTGFREWASFALGQAHVCGDCLILQTVAGVDQAI